MGGNAFKIPNVQRIHKNDIDQTINKLVTFLDNLISEKYISNNLLGSTKKQETSGDIDIALDSSIFNKKSLLKIAEIFSNKLGPKFVTTKQINAGQLNTLFPILNDPNNGYIQIDFILGNTEYLKFSHYSAGEKSNFKGVCYTTLWGILAKLKEEYSAKCILETSDLYGKTLVKVNHNLHLELGLCKKFIIYKDNSYTSVSANEFETHIGKLVNSGLIENNYKRISRYNGYLTNPKDIIRILLNEDVEFNKIDTFEKLFKIIYNKVDKDILLNKFLDSISRSGLKYYENIETTFVKLHELINEY